MLYLLGSLTKNGKEKWNSYKDAKSGEKLKPKDDAQREAWKTSPSVKIEEVTQYKFSVGNIQLMLPDDYDKTLLPPAGSIVFVEATREWSTKKSKEYFRFVGLASPHIGTALLGAMVKIENEKTTPPPITA